jgi:hypothetical protein
MSPNSFQFSARHLAGNSLGAPLHLVDPQGFNRMPNDVAGLRVAISPGFGSAAAGITFLMAAEPGPQPTGPGFRGFIGLLLDLFARGPRLQAQASGRGAGL